jgi:hypothetical protein
MNQSIFQYIYIFYIDNERIERGERIESDGVRLIAVNN